MRFAVPLIFKVLLSSLGLVMAAPAPRPVPRGPKAELWLTTPDRTALFQRQAGGLAFGAVGAQAPAGAPVIEVDAAQKFQGIDGFGYCLTGGSAQLLRAMSALARARLLQELFGTTGNAIGVSYLRLSIGASDLDARVFSYDDLPAGETDPALAHFSLAPDEKDLIPVLKEILAISPDIKLLGSPWSPPTWMKTNGNSKGGSLKPEFYDAYARYFVKYIQGMKAHGIRLDAVTVQNEPLHPGNNPSLLMEAPDQAVFIGQHLGPAFETARLNTKIICYDHNADRPDYPLAVLDDATARPYVDGSAFHLYRGEIGALAQVHAKYPSKNLYFTEEWVGAPGNLPKDLAWHTKQLTIGATRNWCRTVLEWNLAADSQQNPHTPGGCTECLGALTLAGDAVTRNPAYYITAHASKFVRPGSVRIASTLPAGLPNVAFRTPAGRTVLVVLNERAGPQAFAVRSQGRVLAATLAAGAVGTYVW